MLNSRRAVLRTLSSAVAAGALLAPITASQDPFPPRPQSPVRSGEDEPNVPPRNTTKGILEENQKDIKKNVEKLYELASQLKDQVEKTDSTTILSLAMVKKAEEIERLARQIKERAKG